VAVVPVESNDRDRAEPEGIELLRTVMELIGALPDGGGVAGQRFLAAIAHYEVGAADGAELAACLGLVPAPSHPAWWTTEAREKRAGLILELDALMFGADRPSQHGRALKIAQRLRRYEADTWPRERSLPVPPAEPLRCVMWKLLKLGAAPGWRTVERRLAAARAADLPNAAPIGDKGSKRTFGECSR
jgi:hypothetical protein